MAAVGLTGALIAATVLFAVFIAARSYGFKACAACAAFASVWLSLLALRLSGVLVDPVLIGILMGGSTVGVLGILKGRLPERYGVFTFPYLATLFTLAYAILGGAVEPSALVLTAALWGVSVLAFFVAATKWADVVERFIQCCKNW